MLTRCSGGCLLVLAAAAHAQAPDAPRAVVEEFRPLLVRAIDAPTGTAKGVLTGPLVQVISSHFGTSAPILVDVRTVARYAQPGCRRLQVLVWQEGVRLAPGEAPGRQSMEFGINYCRDGLPPASLAVEGAR
ncbi:hypothetical protein [Massilia sp. BJB1822]|uniref:hypothetical protein n=1 Tax=Massilia sp. BJB1822 TaxID=2744470 RepID=UPI001593EE38|nr:hypothetical protein [Massilia sp. BJB1822]NVD97710.1 hypothetical protein [Massilia sp. BJB1822]